MNYTLIDSPCIHCDWQANYYSEVRDAAIILWMDYNRVLEGDDRAEWWDSFIEEAIDIVAQKKDTMTICINCDSPFSYL